MVRRGGGISLEFCYLRGAMEKEKGKPKLIVSAGLGPEADGIPEKNAPVRRSSGVLKTLLLVSIGVWTVVVVVLQVILTPDALKRIATGFANEYVDGTVSFSSIEASMFKNFPNLNVSIEDFSITYPKGMFQAQAESGQRGAGRSVDAENPLMSLGCGPSVDTLLSFKKFSGGVNYLSAIFGKVRIRRAELEHPRIFAKQYGGGRANWDIFKVTLDDGGEDSSAFRIPSVSLGRICLTDKPMATYSNPEDTVGGGIFIKQVEASGHYSSGKKRLEGLSFTIDSLLVAGRLPSDTLAFALDRFEIDGRGEDYDMRLRSKLHLLLKSAGRMSIPLEATASFIPKLRDKLLSVTDLRVVLATLDIAGEGELDWSGGKSSVRARLAVDKEPVKEVIDFFKANFPILKELKTNARMSAELLCEGCPSDSNFGMPPLTVRLKVPESRLEWTSLKEKGDFSLEATASVKDGAVSAKIPGLRLSINGLDLDVKGKSDDLLGADPLLDLDTEVSAVLGPLVRFIPDSLGIAAEGRMEGRLKGGIRLSQLDIYNFSSSGLEGSFASDGLRLDFLKDSLSAFLGEAAVSIGRSVDKHGIGTTGVAATIDSLFAEHAGSTYFGGSIISLSAHNASETMEGDRSKHPLDVSLDIGALGMMDLDSCFVGLSKSTSSFRFTKKAKGDLAVPYLSFSSANGSFAVRQGVNRFTLSDAVISASAFPNAYETESKRQHILDSLRKAYPGVPLDSVFRKAYGGGFGKGLPDFLSEKDFEKKDIDIRLDESLAEYVRNWDISGSLKIGEAKVISPYYPLENKLTGVDCSFDNNRVRLSEARLSSGGSDISARGTLSGLKRSLTGRGRLSLDLGISSDFIDADEILGAINAGKNFVPPGGNTALAEIDDESYLDSVRENSVIDTTADKLVVIPSNLNARISLQAGKIKYSKLETSWASSDIEMKERCLQVTNTLAMTNMGDIFIEGFYSTKTKKDLKAGFDLMLSNITAEKVIELFPVVDSLVPMLSSIRGLLDCEVAATASIDTSMSLVLPSLSGILKLDGKNLALADGVEVNKLRKTLMFKDKDSSNVDNMSIRGIIKDNKLEVFPFVVNVDRYRLAASGLQNFDQKFQYHISALKSPVPFRFGVNLKGSLEDWRWRLAKAKYKNAIVPAFDDQVDDLRFKLLGSIHNIFDRGAEGALEQNERAHQAIEDKKSELSYSVDSQVDSLSASELKTIEELEAVEGKTEEVGPTSPDGGEEETGDAR